MKNQFDELEQLEMAQRILKRLNGRRKPRPQFAVGDRVSFNSPGRGTLRGVITQVRRGRATLRLDADERPWRVDLTLLRADTARPPSRARSASIIAFPRPPRPETEPAD